MSTSLAGLSAVNLRDVDASDGDDTDDDDTRHCHAQGNHESVVARCVLHLRHR